ncbi:MAG: TIGR00270 family protein [Candidatus Thorarchaeota archaeon]|nr:TIGR00270 family protein [Candidatus Thorarchaeota archaeon]
MKFGHSSSESTQRPSSRPRTSWTESPERQTPSQDYQPSRASKPRPQIKPMKSTGVRLDDMELIEDYAKIIRSARQKKNMSQDELAQRVGESISTLKSIESGRQKPTEKTIRGLERELEISLLEPLGTVPIKAGKVQTGIAGPTLGDRVIVKKKMSQKARREDSEI